METREFCRQDVCKFAFPDAAWMWKSFTKLGASFQKKPFGSVTQGNTALNVQRLLLAIVPSRDVQPGFDCPRGVSLDMDLKHPGV
ncbi:hypothetical protein CB1_002263011 [Camelus ferus]|nr:hypothetical protein CB1_002263011 [Camelus ferus]